MRRTSKFKSLELLEQSQPGIHAESPHAGTLDLDGLKGKILIEPDHVLWVQLGDFIEDETISLAQLLSVQKEILAPVKFVWQEPSAHIGLVGELPLNGAGSLDSGFNLLKEGFLHAKLLKKVLLEGQSRMPKGTYCKNGALSTKQAKDLVDSSLKSKNYEVTEKEKTWLISLNTVLYFQRIEILLDEMSHYLQLRTTLTNVPKGNSTGKSAICAFLLHAAGRLRFVRGIMGSDEKSQRDVVALEVIVPLKYINIFRPETALESLIVATRYTRLACEALMQEAVAEAYLQRWSGKLKIENNQIDNSERR
ncbi:MAG: hypothetical protein ACE5NG_03865 [bacterium]